MEKNRNALYSNNGNQAEPSDQRIPSRKYNDQGPPDGQGIPSVQNSDDREPSEQHTPTSQNNEQDPPSYQNIPSKENAGFDGVSQLTSNQQPAPTYYVGQNPYPLGPGQYVGPQVHYVPGQQVYIVPTNGQAIPQPGVQYMVRDTTTPMPSVKEEVKRPIECIITLRVISTLVILLDICLNWIQVASWNDSNSVPDWLNFLEIVNSLKETKFKAKCDGGSESLTTTYALFCAAGTAYGLVRIVNMVGETIIEYNKQRPSENEPRFKGFQIIHGWVETILGVLCDDIPQVILLLFFSWKCDLDPIVALKVFLWMTFKNMKNGIRFDSCKHHYKPPPKCCESKGCCEDCCEYSFNFFCCCRILYFRPCACSGEKQCLETKSYEICPDLSCSRGEKCCGEFEKDPEWAENLYLKLAELFSFLYMAMIILTLIKSFT